MKTTSGIDRKGNEAWDTCREHFSFPASIIMASNLQHHAHSSLLKLANVAKRCREGLRDMRHAQRDAVLPDLPKYRATSEWKAVNGRRFSSRAKPRLCLPKTSHLINPKACTASCFFPYLSPLYFCKTAGIPPVGDHTVRKARDLKSVALVLPYKSLALMFTTQQPLKDF